MAEEEFSLALDGMWTRSRLRKRSMAHHASCIIGWGHQRDPGQAQHGNVVTRLGLHLLARDTHLLDNR